MLQSKQLLKRLCLFQYQQLCSFSVTRFSWRLCHAGTVRQRQIQGKVWCFNLNVLSQKAAGAADLQGQAAAGVGS